MSYLSSHSVLPHSLYFREKSSPFPHWTVSSHAYPCNLYDILLRVKITGLSRSAEFYKVRLDQDSIRRWSTIESAISQRVPNYEPSLHKDEQGSYLSIPANVGSDEALQSNTTVIHLRVKWIYKTSYGTNRVLLYVYDGTTQ